MRARSLAVLLLAGLGGCGLELNPRPEMIHARCDPDEKVIPMPTDVLRDAEAGHLDVPIDDENTAAEVELFTVIATLGAPLDVTAANLAIETFLPMNPESAARLAELSAARSA